MITVKTMTNGDIFRQSDENYYLRRKNDNVIFSSARDKATSTFIYEEATDLDKIQINDEQTD